MNGLVMVPVVVESGIWAGLKSQETRAINSMLWSKSRNNAVKVTNSKSVLVCQEEALMSKWNGVEQQPFKNFEGKISLRVKSPIPKEISNDPRSNSHSSNSNRSHKISRMKLHFLEEREEGILSSRILNLSRSNKVRSALELYMSMEVSGIQPNVHACNSLLSCLIRNGSLHDAIRVFQTMSKKEIATAHTYSLILKAVASGQGVHSALEMFKTLDGEETSAKKFDVIVYNTMIMVCGKAKNWVEAESLWRRLKKNGLRETMVTYCLLVSAFVQCGQTELALDVYHEMVKKGFQPDEDVMKAIVASCTKEGKWTVAFHVFRKMLDSGAKPNIIVYNSMINCLGKAGEADLAFRIYDLMKSLGHEPDVYTWNALLTALYRCERYTDTLRLFMSIKSDHGSLLNVHLYNTALLSCERLGLWERSLQLLWQMETSGLSLSTEPYNHVIRACESARKPKVALQVYRRMIQKKCDPDTFTYLSLIRACVWGSLWTEVEELLENVTPNASLYNALVHGFCLRGKLTLAKKLYKKMRDCGITPDGKTRALMLQHLPDTKNKRK